MTRWDSNDEFDPFAELGLSPQAEPELIKAAFKTLAKKYHPDRFPDTDEKARAEKRMARINEAQRLLQSGNYRPPTPKPREHDSEPPTDSYSRSTESPPPPPRAPKKSSQTSQPDRSESSLAREPTRIGALVFVALLAVVTFFYAPTYFTGDLLTRALLAEEEDRLEDSLSHLNQAIRSSPHDRELYGHRARIFEKLGQPDKAAIDRQNARVPSLDGYIDNLTTPTPSASPLTEQVIDQPGASTSE